MGKALSADGKFKGRTPSRAVVVFGVRYESFGAAERSTGISKQCIYYWIRAKRVTGRAQYAEAA